MTQIQTNKLWGQINRYIDQASLIIPQFESYKAEWPLQIRLRNMKEPQTRVGPKCLTPMNELKEVPYKDQHCLSYPIEDYNSANTHNDKVRKFSPYSIRGSKRCVMNEI
jgi:hypothetical protein